MLITFKSAAAADVMMFGEVARKLLQIIGKDPDDTRGIVTVEQLPGAIASLRAAIDEDRARQAGRSAEEEEADAEAGRTGMAAPVGIAQRAYPVLEMMEYSQKEDTPVIWEGS